MPTPEFDIESLPHMVQFNDQPVAFEKIEPAGGEGTNRWFRVDAAHSHRRAAVRALFETNGLKVSRVIQVKYAHLELPRDLPRGKHQALTESQVADFYELAEIEQPKVERPRARAPRKAADRQRKPTRARGGKPSGRPAAPKGKTSAAKPRPRRG